MSRIYSVAAIATGATASGDIDWLELSPADDKPIKLCRLVLSQTSEVGDTQEEGLRFSLLRITTSFVSGSGGSAATIVPLDTSDPAAGFTGETFNTTVATGTAATLEEIGWNVRNTPFELVWPDPEWRPTFRQGEALILRQQTTIADAVDFLLTAYIEET